VSPYHAKKRLGQNFLTSEKVIGHIVDLVSPRPDQTIVEIGSGRGALTFPLAESGAQVWAIEFDRDLIGSLERRLDRFANVNIVARDFLTFHPEMYDLSQFVLVGNLPYNITSPVIDWCIRYRDRITAAYFMVQNELAMRLTAVPGTHDWSPLSIFAQIHFNITYCFDVPAHAFTPPPEVISAFVSLVPVTVPINLDTEWFERVVRQAFRQRRKQLVNNLVPELFPDAESAKEAFRMLGWSESCRAEEIPIDQFCRLTTIIARRHSVDT
jgi:16S rRNA (adenine1518-N6/adenine1519-N6)-dimethyltransferase